MASFRSAVAVSLALLFTGVAHAQSPAQPPPSGNPAKPPPPIRAFDLPQIEAFGAAIYRQDIAAWLATDALVAKVPDLQGAGVKGWLVEDDGKAATVRFLRDVGTGLEIGYDIVVDGKGAGPVTEPAVRKLTDDERLMFSARQAAIAAKPSSCRPGYNTAIVRDPQGDGFIVWLLAPSPAAGAIPFGGHYRVTVAGDGRTVTRVDALSASCLLLDRDAKDAKGDPVMMYATHIVSPTPVESHVFLSLLYKLPLAIGTGPDEIWLVDQGRVQKARLK
ncbi:MAG: hypothetical protein QM608_20880 [Caulobacter sp.]